MSSDPQIMKLLEEAWSRRREGNYEDMRALLVKARGLCEHGDYDFLACELCHGVVLLHWLVTIYRVFSACSTLLTDGLPYWDHER